MVNNLMSTSEEHMQTVKAMAQSYSRKEVEAIYYLSKELAKYEKQEKPNWPHILVKWI